MVPPQLQDVFQCLVMCRLCGSKNQEVVVNVDGVRFEGHNLTDLLTENLRGTVHSKVQTLETLESSMGVKRCQLPALFR